MVYSPQTINSSHVVSKPLIDQESEKENTQAASAVNASLFYQDSMLVSKSTTSATTVDASTVKSKEKPEEKSLIDKVSDWFWGLFRWATTKDVEQDSTETPANSTDQLSPKLPEPDPVKSQLIKTIDEMKKLVKKIDDIITFEEELTRASENHKDHLFFKHLIALSLSQKAIKEEFRELCAKEAFDIRKINQALLKEHHDLQADILKRKKLEQGLFWGGIAATVLTTGVLAASVLLTGPMATVAVVSYCLLSLVKGGMMVGETYHKGNTDKKAAELFGVGHEMKSNHTKTQDQMDTMQNSNKEIGNLLKQVRHYLKNHSEVSSQFSRNK